MLGIINILYTVEGVCVFFRRNISCQLAWSWWCRRCWAGDRWERPGWLSRRLAPCQRSASWESGKVCRGSCSEWWGTGCQPGPPRTGWQTCWSSPAPPAGEPCQARPGKHLQVSVKHFTITILQTEITNLLRDINIALITLLSLLEGYRSFYNL